jgi:hypothetical protein
MAASWTSEVGISVAQFYVGLWRFCMVKEKWNFFINCFV